MFFLHMSPGRQAGRQAGTQVVVVVVEEPVENVTDFISGTSLFNT